VLVTGPFDDFGGQSVFAVKSVANKSDMRAMLSVTAAAVTSTESALFRTLASRTTMLSGRSSRPSVDASGRDYPCERPHG
jgi:hypothetical protein